MARITVEDCLKKVENQYDLVLLAKERTTQLNNGAEPLVPEDNDKKTVISLREIAEDKVSPKDLEESAIEKLREHQEEDTLTKETEEIEDDNFSEMYKGEISKSGTAILPSKRVRKIPQIIQENKTTPSTETDENKTITKPEEDSNLVETEKAEDPT